jgi:hypothetical protein
MPPHHRDPAPQAGSILSLPGLPGLPALPGMPPWLEDALLAVVLVVAASYATEPVLVFARRRRRK